jgi:hypothetical protein
VRGIDTYRCYFGVVVEKYLEKCPDFGRVLKTGLLTLVEVCEIGPKWRPKDGLL